MFHLGPNGALEVFGIRLVGLNATNLRKLLFTVAFLVLLWLLRTALKAITTRFRRDSEGKRVEFWTKQGIHLLVAVIAVLGLFSIWVDNPQQISQFAALLTAGVAFALQRVITALAAYLVLLQGKVFNVGDRIMMGGVRGDVIALGFIRTTIMEMGQPPGEQSDPPDLWVQARQYTGRIVTVTNDKIFDEPVYNYSRDFPFLWEEMRIPVSFKDDRHRAEQILLEVARKHTVSMEQMSQDALAEMERRYFMRRSDIKPRVFWRITDNWIELAVRFIAPQYGVRDLKDKMSRDIMAEFDKAGIGVASSTYDVVGMPPLKVQVTGGTERPDRG
jgi:small-conductance mechanosensitive channel